MKKNSEYIEIDLGRIFKALIRKFWILILTAAVCGAATFSYACFFVAPTYEASALMYVNNNALTLGSAISLTSSDLYASQELVSTYIVIMKSRTTLNEVIERANLQYSYEKLYSMVSASTKSGTAIFNITVSSTDPQEAAKIANTLTEVLPQKIADILDGSSARVVDYAVVPRQKASPNITLYTMAGALAGLVLSALVLIIIELMNDSILNADMLPDTDTIPVLGKIPNLRKPNNSDGYNKYSYAKRKTSGKGERYERNEEREKRNEE